MYSRKSSDSGVSSEEGHTQHFKGLNYSSFQYASRIVSLSHPDNKVLWVSDVIPGEVQGRPQVTERKPGEYIVFTHNQLNMTTGELYGSVSMILADSGMLAWTENAGDSSIDPNLDDLQLIDDLRLPYGPIGVAHFPEEGRYPGGEGNNNDIFVWATSDNDGLGPSGYTRAFQIPRLFEPAFARKFFVSTWLVLYLFCGSLTITSTTTS
jgi:hypothetical protein